MYNLNPNAFALVVAVAVASGVGPGFSLGIYRTTPNPFLPAGGQSKGAAEATDLSPLLLSLLLPLFSPFSPPYFSRFYSAKSHVKPPNTTKNQ
jgi:hypothetical protein